MVLKWRTQALAGGHTDQRGCTLDVQMNFNHMLSDDSEDEYYVWGNGSFLCSRFSFVKM